MEMYKVIYLVCASIFYLNYVVGMQFFSVKQVFSTHWHFQFWFFATIKMFRPFSPIGFTVLGISIFPVGAFIPALRI